MLDYLLIGEIVGEGFIIMTDLHETVIMAGISSFVIASLAGIILTYLMCKLSWHMGVVDRPDGCLKCHDSDTATLGGIPLFIATVISIFSVLYFLNKSIHSSIFNSDRYDILWGVFCSSVIILILGICDDLHQVSPRTKLLFQIVAAFIVIESGLVVTKCGFFGVFDVSFGLLAIPFTMFWLVGSCNAFNFIDGMDGLASGIGVITAIMIGILGLINGAFAEAIIAMSIAGGLFAVLIFNFKPAKIFLGDSGSQLMGLILGALALKVATVNGVFSLPGAGLILSIPVLDTFLSILRRFSVSESPANGDHNHIHHCLHRNNLGVRQVVIILWFATAIVGGLGMVFTYSAGTVSASAAALYR